MTMQFQLTSKTSFCGILGVLLSLFCNGQNNPYNEVSIASPTAASLGKYADIPVNYHTGIPQISIPIYTVKEGPLSLPIGLSYHASGLRVLETSSWVGAGWSLSAGGVITRTVQGAPDERNVSNITSQDYGHLSNNGYNKYLWITGPAPFNGSPQWSFSQQQDWLAILDGRKDAEPDLYFFNFAGYSGKFYFHDDGAPVLVPQQDLRIEYNYTPGVGNSISSFTVTTPDGTKYKFGRTDATNDTDPVERTHPFDGNNYNQGQALSSWYLNRVESADGIFAINLSYSAENYSYYTYSTFPIDANSNAYEYKPIKNIVSGVRLSQIQFSNGSVTFSPSTSARLDLNGSYLGITDDANTESKSLESIIISNSGSNCKKFLFSYSYFDDNSTPLPANLVGSTDRKRLKLNSVQEQTCDGSVTIPPHNFEYFTEFVPRRMSFAVDHWGFHNGTTGNTKLIPTYTVNEFTEIAGANRDASWPAMRGGALKRIIYPTGGYSEFEFEANTAWVSYTKKQWIYRFGQNAGYDGSSNWVINTQTFSGATYKMWFANSALGSQALLNIYRTSDNALMNGWVLEPGQTFVTNLSYSAGTYRIELRKLSAVSGNGASVSFDEWVPTLIQKDETIGGLRIKKIIHHDAVSANNNMETHYTYVANSKSTGVLYSRPNYVYKIRNDITRDIGYQDGPACNPYGCIDCNGSVYVKSGSGIRPMETTQGNHIGYGEVKVFQTGNGYSIYRYYGSNIWDLIFDDVAYRSIVTGAGCEPTITNFPFAPLPHEFKRGELKYEGHFNEASQLLKESEYYPVFTVNPVKTPALLVAAIPNSSVQTMAATFYELSTSKKTEMQVVERVNVPGVGISQTTSYSYFESPYHNQVTRKTTTSSKGETIETKFRYSPEFRIASCDAISTCETDYTIAANVALDSLNARRQRSASNHLHRWWAWQAYIKDLSIARSNYVDCRKANYTGATNAFKTCFTNYKNSTADSWLKPIMELQDHGIITPIETSSWRGSKLTAASFFKYEYATTPANKVYPARVLTIDLQTPSTTFTVSAVSGNTISKDSRYAEESSAKFYNGNLAEITSKAGVTTSYIWGHNNTLPIVKAVGVSQATLLAAYNAVSGNLNTLRSQPSLSGALVNTYEYNPLLGITKETNPNSRNQLYEYDGLYRLLRIRDHDNNILKQFEYKYQFLTCAPNWQNEGGLYCETSGGANTGNQLQLQRDMNPCSPTYNTTRSVFVAYNTTACPLSSCHPGNCYGIDKKCIDGVCRTGWKVYTGSYYNWGMGMYECTYHYEWVDGSWSESYTEYSYNDCLLF